MKKKARFKINPKIVYKKVDEQIFVLDSKNAKLITLNETASFIWENLKRYKTVDQVCLIIARDYDININSVKKDIENFLVKYSKTGILLKKYS